LLSTAVRLACQFTWRLHRGLAHPGVGMSHNAASTLGRLRSRSDTATSLGADGIDDRLAVSALWRRRFAVQARLQTAPPLRVRTRIVSPQRLGAPRLDACQSSTRLGRASCPSGSACARVGP